MNIEIWLKRIENFKKVKNVDEYEAVGVTITYFEDATHSGDQALKTP